MSYSTTPEFLPLHGLPEDPRLFMVNDCVFLSFVRYVDSLFRHFMVELNINHDQVQILKETEHELRLPGTNQHEKNWVPFAYDGKLHFVYSIFPHRVVEWNPDCHRLIAEYVSTPDFSRWAAQWESCVVALRRSRLTVVNILILPFVNLYRRRTLDS